MANAPCRTAATPDLPLSIHLHYPHARKLPAVSTSTQTTSTKPFACAYTFIACVRHACACPSCAHALWLPARKLCLLAVVVLACMHTFESLLNCVRSAWWVCTGASKHPQHPPVSSFTGHDHWGGTPPLNNGRAASTLTIGARQRLLWLTSFTPLTSVCTAKTLHLSFHPHNTFTSPHTGTLHTACQHT